MDDRIKLTLGIIFLIVVILNNAVVLKMVYDHEYPKIQGKSIAQGTVSLEVQAAQIEAPIYFEIYKINNSAVYLNWSEVSGATAYHLYYSEDAHSLSILNVSNISDDVGRISALTVINYTDINITSGNRFYRVSAFNDNFENVMCYKQHI